MPSGERMSIDERRKCRKLVAARYSMAGRSERSRPLTEMTAVTGLHRKSVLRLMHGPTLERAPGRPRFRRRRYGVAVADVVRVVWGGPGLFMCGAVDTGAVVDGAASGPL